MMIETCEACPTCRRPLPPPAPVVTPEGRAVIYRGKRMALTDAQGRYLAALAAEFGRAVPYGRLGKAVWRKLSRRPAPGREPYQLSRIRGELLMRLARIGLTIETAHGLGHRLAPIGGAE